MKKRILIITVMIFGVVGGLIYDLSFGRANSTNELTRPTQGAGDQTVLLKLDADDKLSNYEYEFVVEEQIPSQKEIEEYFAMAKKEIMETIFDGQPADCVRKNLKLQDDYANHMVKVEWNFDPPQYIDENGSIFSEYIPNEGVLVNAQIALNCAKNKEILAFSFKIFAPERSEKDRFLDKIDLKLHTELQKEGEEVQLPESIDGVLLHWKVAKEKVTVKILLMELIILVVALVYKREKQKEQKNRVEKELRSDYAKIVSTMAILMASGMTIRQSWNKISARYITKRQENQIKRREGYEVIVEACQRMKSGESERTVYRDLGECVKLAEYRHLSRMLVQNFEKGNKGIAALLEAESESAFEERKRIAMKLGEEAGTKMLFPMIMMLGLIMAIILIPAIVNFTV